MNKLFATDDDWTGLILRLTLGVVAFPHGAQKLFGWFGGYGFSGTMGFFTEQMGVPAIVAFLVIMGESLGSVALILGLMTRFSAAGIGVIMLGAVSMVHLQNGFFMNWSGSQAGEGFEYHLLVIGIAVVLTLIGGGKWSADGMIARRLEA